MNKIQNDVFQYVIKPFLIPNEEIIKTKKLKFINNLINKIGFKKIDYGEQTNYVDSINHNNRNNELKTITVSYCFFPSHTQFRLWTTKLIDSNIYISEFFLSIQIEKDNPLSYRKIFNFLKYLKTYIDNPILENDYKTFDYYIKLTKVCIDNYFQKHIKLRHNRLIFSNSNVNKHTIYKDWKNRITLFLD